jgi:hypothetical protein
MATPKEQNREQSERARREREQQLPSDAAGPEGQADGDETANPPRTTTGDMTAPKFGSAGSGGAELEPGPERP